MEQGIQMLLNKINIAQYEVLMIIDYNWGGSILGKTAWKIGNLEVICHWFNLERNPPRLAAVFLQITYVEIWTPGSPCSPPKFNSCDFCATL